MSVSSLRALGLLAFVVGSVGACGGTEVREERRSALEHGEFLFTSKASSPSAQNLYSCTTCHPGPGESRKLAGAALGGVTERPSFWGGAVLDLLEAINLCRTTFMDARIGWTADDDDARAMYLYLKGLAPSETRAVPFTVVRSVTDVPRGDSARGAELYERACLRCHGTPRAGEGRLRDVARLPDDTIADHVGYTPLQLRLVFVQKVRHGPFLGYGGVMPPFSTEVLSDAELGDVLAFLGQ